ncbi:MAG: heme biosynthesis HemY N-terminal domain-containing protein [Methylovirgula sp.]
MTRVLLFFVILAVAGLGIVWIVDRPGEIAVTWQGYRIETTLVVTLGVVALAAVLLAILFLLLRFLFRLPTLMAQRAEKRRRAKGYAALTRGMVAVGAGDAKVARHASAEADRHLPPEPLTLFLAAQSAQLAGDRAGAESAFGKLAQDQATRLLGLRGLHVEAQRRGDHEAAIHFAQEAHKIAPLPWSAKAVLDHHVVKAQWEHALAAIESHIAAKLVDRKTGERQRAVLETAVALDKATQAPEEALRLARQALRRAPDLIPAAALAARLLARKGELRKAAKLIESAWQRQPHPELAEAYLDLRPGDSNADRLAKARTLDKLMPRDPESGMIVARAALAARDFPAAREAMAPLVGDDARPTARMCLIMAELEDAETGDQGRVRQWLARSARAPRDPVWMADGVAAAQWAPVSPVTGRLDAFVWQKPLDRLGTDIDARDWSAKVVAVPVAEIAPPPAPEPNSAPPEAAPSAAEPMIEKPPPRPAGPVIFPMPAPPDDPGLGGEKEDKDNVRLF